MDAKDHEYQGHQLLVSVRGILGYHQQALTDSSHSGSLHIHLDLIYSILSVCLTDIGQPVAMVIVVFMPLDSFHGA